MQNPKNIGVYGNRWFDRAWGNTYHTARLVVDGKCVHKTEMEYGYGDQYLETGLSWLEENGHIPKRTRSPHTNSPEALYQYFERTGITIDYYASDVGRKRDL